jgi:FKBP-type peptidyl-prolyl cis-trans isomerase FkpA
MRSNFLIVLLSMAMIFACKESDGVTKSGFKYLTLNEGKGDKPGEEDWLVFSLLIETDDEEVLYESGEGAEMPAFQLGTDVGDQADMVALVEILSISRKGGKYELTIPSKEMPDAAMQFPDAENFIFHLEIMEIFNQEEFEEYQAAIQEQMMVKMQASMERLTEIEALNQETLEAYKANRLDLKKTDTGLGIYIVEEGDGENAQAGDEVSVNYYGSLLESGEMFDNSYRGGQDFSFTLGTGSVIPGWDEGITYLNNGAKAFIFIPYDLAYGEMGRPPFIPEKADLLFYVEVNQIARKK